MEKNNRNKQTQQRAYRQQYPIELPMVMMSFLVDLYGLKLAFGEDVRRIAKRTFYAFYAKKRVFLYVWSFRRKDRVVVEIQNFARPAILSYTVFHETSKMIGRREHRLYLLRTKKNKGPEKGSSNHVALLMVISVRPSTSTSTHSTQLYSCFLLPLLLNTKLMTRYVQFH